MLVISDSPYSLDEAHPGAEIPEQPVLEITAACSRVFIILIEPEFFDCSQYGHDDGSNERGFPPVGQADMEHNHLAGQSVRVLGNSIKRSQLCESSVHAGNPLVEC